MSKLLSLALAVTLFLAFGSSPVAAQDTPALSPFADEAFGVEGVLPDGWAEVQPGLYARASSTTDVTVLAVQTAPIPLETLWPALLPQFALTAVPESSGSLESPAYEWLLYHIEVTQPGITVVVDLALAEQEGKSTIVLLQASPEDRDALYDAVFVPVVESITPLVEDVSALPYSVEEVTFANGEVTLAGTLTLPEGTGPHPAVVLMTGSGPQDRDELVAGFPVFRRIADDLTRRGIAVLRYDDRGVGQSTGDWAAATLDEFAADGQAGVAYLQSRDDINADQVGVLGHSIGGVLASILGAEPESGLAFIISMAGPGVNGYDTLLEQNKVILAQQGLSQELIDLQIDFLVDALPLMESGDWDAVDAVIGEMINQQWDLLSPEDQASTGADSAESLAQMTSSSLRAGYANGEFVSLLAYDPALDWAQTTVPVLAIFGEFDLQVPPEIHAPALEAALEASGNPDATVVVIDAANHLFQATETGAIEEYAQLPPEFVPEFLPLIGDWILERVTVAAS